jgi:hypothetical protein
MPSVETAIPSTLYRLQLAAMQAIGLNRILTNDSVQWKEATALGFRAISPSI